MMYGFLRLAGGLALILLLPACGLLDLLFFGTETTFCPISPRLPDHPVAEQMRAPVGEYPVWFVTIDSIPMSELGRSQPPYNGGTVRKTLVVVTTDLEGELVITGRQLDGDAQVLFPQRIDEEIENADGSSTIVYSEDDLAERHIVPNPQIPTNGTWAEGYASHPLGLYFPEPGCYQLSGSYGGYTANTIVEVRDE
jgi:hypothetical protein